MSNISKKISWEINGQHFISLQSLLFYCIILVFVSCSDPVKKVTPLSTDTTQVSAASDTSKIEKDTITEIVEPIETQIVEMEQILIDAGLVKITDVDSTIIIDLKYSTSDNFVGIDMYGDFEEGYLQPEVAKKLAKAHQHLKDSFPDFRFIVYDAVRPKTIQKMMWDSVKMPPQTKARYLSNPKYGSLHNYGAAVDLTIVDSTGTPLDMGTSFDSFEEMAQPILESRFLKEGKLTEQQIANRLILRGAMKKGGFFGIRTEWWHFSVCRLKTAMQWFTPIKSHKYEKPIFAESVPGSIEGKIDIIFRVQLSISDEKTDKNSAIFKNLEVYEYYHEGYYKYATGNLKTLEEAYEYRDKLRDEMGFTDSFVISFNNDERIGIRDAIEMI